MFFYPTVLNHRTGCFATIWLAATKGRKISRRDLLQVNVQRTCCDIMDYVLVRVPPPLSGLPRPRFSLYLSSQLQYGVVFVYHRQCEFLLEETQLAIDRLLRLNLKFNIDMRDEESRQTHMIPDAAALFDETEGARDPFFGVMETGYGLPSPSSLIQRMEEVLPEQVPSSREPTPPSDGITASQESITLTEREPDIIPEPEFEGADLQETNMIELLLEQPDHFLEREDERQLEIDREREQIEKETEEDREPGMPDEREQERAALEREAARDLTTSVSLDLAQITGASSQEVVLLPEEDLRLPMEMPVLEEREKTPVSVPIPSPPPGEEEIRGVEPERERAVRERSPDLEPAAVRPESPIEGRKRRRQLRFIDENTQISQQEMRAQIDDVETETRPLALVKPPFEKKGAKELLENPCMSLPPEILALWKQAAVVRPIPPSQQRRELPVAEEIPEREQERPEPGEREEDRELSSKEIPREMLESGLFQQETPASSVVLETTDKDFSPLETPELRRSPVPQIPFGLEGIPEERLREMEDITQQIEEQPRPEDIIEGLETFHSLLPPEPTRRIVAQLFWRLLEQILAGQVTVQQDEPYGDIIISQL
ncbi:meiotic recombination protein REC8 homolog [Garra rufa]|uniref:meiotic recombination protein REC8 homolog n=1 Tax=Garra rufa TaxID=137080 RepID=UPI003CCEE34A